MGAAAIPLITAVVGTGLQAKAAHDTRKRADAEAQRGLDAQMANQRDTDRQVNQEISSVEASTPEAARASSAQAFLEQLRRTRANAVGGTGGVGGDRYAEDTENAQSDVSNFGTRTADLMARINAPAQQRVAEDQGFANLNNKIGIARRNSGAEQFLSELRMRSIRPDAGLTALGEGLTGVAHGMASRNPKTPKSSGIIGPRE